MIEKIYASSTWDNLKKINSSKIINSMYIWIFIVPIVLKAFELVNKNVYNFKIFNEIVPLNLELPFSLTIFYFSAIFFAFGNLMIKLRCPLIINENNSFSDFDKDGKKLSELVPYLDDINFDWDTLAKSVDKNIDNEYKSYQQREGTYREISPATLLKEANTKKRDPKNYFWEIYGKAKQVRNTSRLFTGFLYLVGFMLMAFVIGQNFYSVIIALLN